MTSMRKTFLCVSLALLLVAGAVSAAQIRHLSSPDALAMRADVDGIATEPLPSPLAWQDKLSPTMWQAAAAGGTQRVLVLLQEPAMVRSPEHGDDLRVRALASIEQGFVERARIYGLRPVKGLTHLPIVIADVPIDSLADIASDPMVRAIDPDIKLHAHRVEGGALINSPPSWRSSTPVSTGPTASSTTARWSSGATTPIPTPTRPSMTTATAPRAPASSPATTAAWRRTPSCGG